MICCVCDTAIESGRPDIILPHAKHLCEHCREPVIDALDGYFRVRTVVDVVRRLRPVAAQTWQDWSGR